MIQGNFRRMSLRQNVTSAESLRQSHFGRVASAESLRLASARVTSAESHFSRKPLRQRVASAETRVGRESLRQRFLSAQSRCTKVTSVKVASAKTGLGKHRFAKVSLAKSLRQRVSSLTPWSLDDTWNATDALGTRECRHELTRYE